MNAKELSIRLAMQAESVAAMLLPNGKRSGVHWVAGNVEGDRGESLKVTITGGHAGRWRDFATDEHGDLIDLWAASRRLSLAEALQEVRDHLGVEREPIRRSRPAPRPSIGNLQGIGAVKGTALERLTKRGITPEVIQRYRIASKGDAVVFPSLSETGERLNVKYLGPDKNIWVEKGGIAALFGWQAIDPSARQLVITEGEIDALTVAGHGFPAVSVPFGAGNHDWIENDWERLDRFDDIVLWFDTDEAGQAGVEEVTNRLGIERCRIAKATTGKDANDMQQRGDLRFNEVIHNAEVIKHPTVRSATDFRDEYMEALYPTGGKEPGFDLGWDGMEWLVFRPSEAVIVTGFNGHGKSQFVGQLCLQAMGDGKRCCIASMELRPAVTLKRLARQTGATDELSRGYANAILDWMGDRLWLYDRHGRVDLDELLDGFDYARKRYGVEVFVIDSLMMLGIARDDYESQSQLLQRIMEWKLDTGATVFIVAHPRKGESENSKPGKMDVRGASEITDMVDTVLVVWRDKSEDREFDGILFCEKQRNGEREGHRAFHFDTLSNQFLPPGTRRSHRYVEYTRAVA